MRALLAFTKKELMQQLRSGRLMILCIIFALLGIMNPATAKLTPWLLEMMSESLAESGMTVTSVTVDAMASWTQFFKNIPIALIAFVLLESNIFTKEYQSGTLVPILTKGLDRYKVVISKTAVLTVIYSAGYWLCFAITYAYNAYFRDNGVAHNLVFSVICLWLLGLWVVMLTVLFSAAASSNTAVLVGTGGVFFAAYLVGLVPRVKEYSPTMLMNTAPLLVGAEKISVYYSAVIITAVLCAVSVAVSIPIMNKRRL